MSHNLWEFYLHFRTIPQQRPPSKKIKTYSAFGKWFLERGLWFYIGSFWLTNTVTWRSCRSSEKWNLRHFQIIRGNVTSQDRSSSLSSRLSTVAIYFFHNSRFMMDWNRVFLMVPIGSFRIAWQKIYKEI